MVSDQAIRNRVYEQLLASGNMPSATAVASSFGIERLEVLEAFKRLYAQRAVALMPESGEVLMASPFSAVPTAYLVDCKGKSWFANCAWDALAIPAAMGARGSIRASCACCGEAMHAEVESRKLLSGEGVLHIAMPAKTWWNDIHFT